jgi:hypothetical protein
MKQMKADIIDAYCKIRQIDHTIPDHVLDYMKEAAIEKLEKVESVVCTNNKNDKMEHIKDLFRHMNSHNRDYAEEMIKYIKTEHRTLQQNFFRMVSTVINAVAKTEYHDERNEASINWCKKVSEIDAFFPYI